MSDESAPVPETPAAPVVDPAPAPPHPVVAAGVTPADVAAAQAQADEAQAAARRALEAAEAAKAAAEQARALREAQSATLEEQVTALSQKIALGERQAVEAARLDALRKMGLRPEVPAEDALLLAPDVDPRTQDGIAQLDAWRESRPLMFAPLPETQTVTVERLTSRIPSAPDRKLFGDEWVKSMVKRSLGGDR